MFSKVLTDFDVFKSDDIDRIGLTFKFSSNDEIDITLTVSITSGVVFSYYFSFQLLETMYSA